MKNTITKILDGGLCIVACVYILVAMVISMTLVITIVSPIEAIVNCIKKREYIYEAYLSSMRSWFDVVTKVFG